MSLIQPKLDPLDVVIDPTSLKILLWIKARMESVRVSGDNLFETVWLSDDENQILEAADTMQADVCAVIPQPPMYAMGFNSKIDYAGAMAFKILVVHYIARDAGGDPSEAVYRLMELGEIAREVITLDPTMGGLCKEISFNGRTIRGVDYDGAPQRVGAGSGKIFYGVSIPFISGWYKLRQNP